MAAFAAQALTLPLTTTPAWAQAAAEQVAATAQFEIPASSLADAIERFGEQSGLRILYEPSLAENIQTPAVSGAMTPGEALTQLLNGTGIVGVSINEQTFVLRRAADAARQGGQVGAALTPAEAAALAAAEGGINAETDPGVNLTGESTTSSVETTRRGGIEEIIVTGQKREERIQDVPIAISAFSMKDLDNQKIEGGFDLLKAVPNVTFSKTNFSGYNFQIRGVGTQAISATTDPGVAVSFNNTTLIVNRLFEQEYLDIERVEVMRGPQGTLFGRNANAGVINVIPSKPEFGVHTGEVRLETGNYSSQRIRGHYNLPLNDDSLALRLAYASTVRDGYVTNEFDGKPIDGRDLSTSRISLGWRPTDSFDVNFSWERFKEDDDRLRSAKNLCHRDNGPDRIANLDVDSRTALQAQFIRRTVHQGCLPGSLYSAGAFDTPNGDAAPFITVGRVNNELLFTIPAGGGFTPGFGGGPTLLTNVDVFSSARQSTDLRTVYSPIEPQYRAAADLYDLTLGFQWTNALRLTSYTVYTQDEVYSTQDFTRYAASPGLFSDIGGPAMHPMYVDFAPGGVFCDPQLGCSSAFLAQDISQSNSNQFNQQFELVSDFDGMWNFSLGVNYTRFETTADYFFFSNVLTALAQSAPFKGPNHRCTTLGLSCISIQQDSLSEVAANPYGHNFFLSRNPYELNSGGVFGESYWKLTPSLKLTLGLRMTWDRKTFTPTPSQTLLADYREYILSSVPSVGDPTAGPEACIRLVLLCGVLGNAPGGIGYPTSPDIVQTWREPTGRFVIDWMPDLPFTDETLVYASYARGYKGGGANPPGIAPPAGIFIAAAQGAVSPKTFEAEYVNAYEVGTKNSFLGGGLTVNATAFYYDYENYQVSKIVDRSASNENFDAKIFGAELEVVVAPTLNWLSNVAIGYLHTRLADGERSIDLMDRAQGGKQFFITEMANPAYDPDATPVAQEDYVAGLTAPAGQAFLAFDDWVVVKPNAAQASNCIAPADLVAKQVSAGIYGNTPSGIVQGVSGFCPAGTVLGDQPSPNSYRAGYAPNGGAGFFADIGGHELPNAPRFTVSLGTQYTFQLPGAWDLTGRVDWYWQDKSYARVYNTEYDRLRDWSSTNFSLWAEKADWDLKIELYVKNAFNDTPITGSFLNSDDTGLTTNIFTLDPRLIGLSILKRF